MNTPNISGKSPAQMFFGRRLRGRLPHLPGANDMDIANAIAGADQRKSLMDDLQLKPATPLTKLSINQRVLVQDPHTKSWNIKGRITDIRPTGRSYDVLLDSGKTVTRNRAYLRPIHDGTKENGKSGQPDERPAVNIQVRRSARLSRK